MKEQFVFANKKYCFLTPVEIPNEPFENYASYMPAGIILIALPESSEAGGDGRGGGGNDGRCRD